MLETNSTISWMRSSFTTGRGGVPNLLNYLTAPNVLIWSAAIASNASSPSLYGRSITLRCKDTSGAVVPWSVASDTTFRPWTHASYNDRDSPLSRIAELFNVNHFIVSQARPYLVPFLLSDMQGPSPLYTRGGRTSLTGGDNTIGEKSKTRDCPFPGLPSPVSFL
ncbi:hypothetical protein F5882DRAFT_103215 [Hyaloscypha sp. PMI_1271]|nr:hypothetical protein F5882DRAFT_103215 [Hyaloscypha sp. PMI_1271]